MIQMSEAVAIAIHAMIDLAGTPDEPKPLKAIAAASMVSENHLSKVLQKLVKAGLVESVMGPRGGYRVLEAKRSATLMEVYEAVEGPWRPTCCLFSGSRKAPCCCLMRPMLESINKTFYDFMTGHTIDGM